jgi:hypothetical protein
LCRSCYNQNISLIEEQEEQRKDLLQYIKKLFKIIIIPEEWLIQIDNYIKEKKTYTGIQKTLYYFYEILDNTILTTYGLSIVKYKYDEAKQYFMKIYETIENNKQVDLTPKIVNITITNSNKKKQKCNIEKL